MASRAFWARPAVVTSNSSDNEVLSRSRVDHSSSRIRTDGRQASRPSEGFFVRFGSVWHALWESPLFGFHYAPKPLA